MTSHIQIKVLKKHFNIFLKATFGKETNVTDNILKSMFTLWTTSAFG